MRLDWREGRRRDHNGAWVNYNILNTLDSKEIVMYKLLFCSLNEIYVVIKVAHFAWENDVFKHFV